MKELKLIPVRVECHSGYKADEYPKCFCRNNERFEIVAITDRWYQGENNPEFPVSNYYKVVTENGESYILKQDLKKDSWSLCL